MRVVIIGSGNTATVLGRLMLGARHEIIQVFSRREEHAVLLARQLKSGWCTDLEQLNGDADLYVVALSDSALSALGDRLSLPGKLIVHTAGSVSKDVLRPLSGNYGVLYPLQSLRKEIGDLPEIPFLVDGGNAEDLERITLFARTLSAQVRAADDLTRQKLHLTGVFINNFSNHLYTLAEDFCDKEKIDFTLLLPLIRETAGRLSTFSPRQVQTGPAVRGDWKTTEKHLELLDKYENIKELYELFTQQIRDFYKEG